MNGPIVTAFWMKPIPPRQFDWQATWDSYEPGDPRIRRDRTGRDHRSDRTGRGEITMNGFWIIMSNSADCELDRKFAKTEDDAKEAAIKMITGLGYLSAGDKIAVKEGWSEED